MSKLFALVKRNLKETLREPLALVFCLGFPLVMLVLMQLLFANIKGVPDIFEIENYAVGICVFGYTFVMLFTAMAISGDKNTEFINRLNLAPVNKATYLFSFVLSMLPVALAQTVIFFAVSLIFGVELSVGLLVAIVYLLPSAVLYITFGVLLGVICKNEKQAGPISSIIISCTSILGGVFMPVDGMGVFTTINDFLPFTHSIKIASGALVGNLGCVIPHLYWVIGYIVALWIINVLLYKRKR